MHDLGIYIVILNHAYIPNNTINYTVSKFIFVNITTNVIRIVFNYSEAIKLMVVGMCFLQFFSIESLNFIIDHKYVHCFP